MKSRIDRFVINQVKQKRIGLGLSQAALARELRVSVGFIGKVESTNYTTHYNLKHVNALAKILKCSPKELLPGRAL